MREHVPDTAEINAMTPRQHATYENSLRRAARRQGLALQKSRARDPRALAYGTYRLVDQDGHSAVAESYSNDVDKNLVMALTGYGMSLDDVHQALLAGVPSRRVQR